MKIHRISFDIPIAPVPASRPRVTRFGTYNSPRYDNFKKAAQTWLASNFKSAPIPKCPITINELSFYIPLPKSWSFKKKKECVGTPHLSRPDKDNLEKAIMDSMEGVVFTDDCTVWRSSFIKKVWAWEGSIFVDLEWSL